MNVITRHDAGGKVKLPLLPGTRGGAQFDGPNDCCRTLRWRNWSEGDPYAAYALFIGMNPSTAEGDVDDPTIRREIGFTKSMGLTAYRKVNVSPYRATDPKSLNSLWVAASCSTENFSMICLQATFAKHVVLAFGTLKSHMLDLARIIIDGLRETEVELWCLGVTKDGSPKHPLYLRQDTPLMLWPGWH